MTKIDWRAVLTKFPSDATAINLEYRGITEMSWEGAPQNLKVINLVYNKITEMSWEGVPKSLKEIYLNYNKITKMSWEGAPQSLREIYLKDPKITQFNWEYAPWNAVIYINYYVDLFKEYKKSRNYIPHLPYISQEHKDILLEPLISLHCMPFSI